MVLTVKANAVPAVSVTVAALEYVGSWSTVKVNAWLAVPVEFLAVNVIAYTPLALAEGVPARVAVPLVPAVKVTPDGSVPVWLRVGVGVPVAVTVKLNALPPVAVAELVLVMASPLLTRRERSSVAVPDVFVAVMTRA